MVGVEVIPAEKRCPHCATVKPAAEFGIRGQGRWLKSWCRACESGDMARRYRSNRPHHNETYRRSRLKWQYGMSEAIYLEMLAEQGGRCAICRTDDPGAGRKNWNVDHDHETGMIRGLLCVRCNHLLGMADDDPERLAAAARYIEAPPAGPRGLKVNRELAVTRRRRGAVG